MVVMHKGYDMLNTQEKKYPLIMVDWLDHTADASWSENIDEHNPELCRSVGWLIKEDDDTLKIANAISKDSGLGGIQVVLKSCVMEVWEVHMIDEYKKKK